MSSNYAVDENLSNTDVILQKSNSFEFKLRNKDQVKLEQMKQIHETADVTDEIILEEYYCSLHKEIIINGKLRVCVRHIWFYANIFGIETSVLFKWSDIISITRQKTALIIPNAIQLLTTSDKMFLSSFVNRDKTYLLLHQLWHFSLNNQESILPDRYYRLMLETSANPTKIDNDNMLNNDGSNNNEKSSNSSKKSSKDDENITITQSTTNKFSQSISDDISMKTDSSLVRSQSQSVSSRYENAEDNNEDRFKSRNTSTLNKLQTYDSGKTKSSLKMNFKLFKKSKNKKKPLLPSYTKTNSFDDFSSKNVNIDNTTKNTEVSSTCQSNQDNSLITSSTTTSQMSSDVNCDSYMKTSCNHTQNNGEDTNDATVINETDLPGECDCKPLSNHITQEYIELHHRKLFDCLFSPTSNIQCEFLKLKKLTNYFHEDISTESDDKYVWRVGYTIPLNWCGKSIDTVTTLHITHSNGHTFVSCESISKGIPYSNAFVTHVHYCIKSVGNGISVINVSFNVKYLQNVWSVTRRIIDKEVKSNLFEFILQLLELTKARLPSMSSKFKDVSIISTSTTNTTTSIVNPNNLQNLSQNINPTRRDKKITIEDLPLKPGVTCSMPNVPISTDFGYSKPPPKDTLDNSDQIFSNNNVNNINYLTILFNAIQNLTLTQIILILILIYISLTLNAINQLNNNFDQFFSIIKNQIYDFKKIAHLPPHQ